ncbi:MAG TPA: CpXC domain-containing protein, partial [Herpetosiphonaceae bacterium]|nr:CpXC domain-containing protein [Herpetosiphonaceae bacterium]
MQSQFLCPNCANPFTPPPLLDSFVFAVDLEPTMDLFEGRLNTTTCPLCKARVSVLTAVIVTNHDEHAILGTLPEGADPAEEEQLVLLAAQHGYSLKIFRNYNELGQAALGWINPYIVPGLSQLLSDEIDQLPLEEKVGLATPFLLRVLKASLDGYLPPVLGFSGGSPEETSGMAEELYRSLLTDHLGNLRKLAVAQNRLPDLPSLIDEHVPRVCLAAPVLGALVDRCGPPIDPESNPQDFVRAYMDEYLCAAAHACAGVPNPRGSAFAIYLARCWRLSRRDDVVFDDRLLLSNAVIHRVLRFEDLWDAVTYRPPDNPLSPEEMKEILPLLDAFGYQQETNRLLGAGIITIPNAGELSPQTKEQLKDVLLETLFTDVAFSRSPEESEGIGVMVAGLVTHLLRNQLQEQTFSALDEVLQRAKAADDPVAVVSICASTIAVLCQNLLYGQASALAGEALKFVSDIRVTARPALCIQIWNEMGNVARYRRQRQAALESYQFAQEMNEIAPLDDEERARNRLTLRRNIAIIYRELGEYRRALELLRSASAAAPEDGGLLHNLAALYLDLNRYDDALGYLDRAVALAPAPVRALERARYLFSRSQVRLALGKAEAGLHDLQEAYQCIPADNRSFRGALAAAALSFYPRSPAGQQFVAECQSLVQELITEGDMDAAPEAPYLRGSLCARLLRDGQVATAGTILDPLWERIQAEDAGYDWRLAYIRGWLEYARHRDARCWPLLVEAGSKIDLAVPIGANVQFAPFWLQDKGEFQDLLVAVALDLVGRGQLPAAELLGVYELMNGREISARLAGEDAPGTQTGSAILDRCAR